MEVKIENLVCVWDDQIPKLLIELVNAVVFTRNKSELRNAMAHLSAGTDFDKFFAYGYGANHLWMKQRLPSAPDKYMENRLLIVEF